MDIEHDREPTVDELEADNGGYVTASRCVRTNSPRSARSSTSPPGRPTGETRGTAESAAGAHGWSPATGWLYSADELAARVDGDAYVLTVSSDGRLRGVQPHDRAPLSAVVRLDGDLVEVVERLDDLADTVAGIDTAEATDINMMRARVDASVRPVDQLDGCAP